MTILVALIAAVPATVAAILTVVVQRRVREVHVLVNAQRTVLENRIAQLEETIALSNQELPATTRETRSAP